MRMGEAAFTGGPDQVSHTAGQHVRQLNIAGKNAKNFASLQPDDSQQIYRQ
jgi:hypothetical protein